MHTLHYVVCGMSAVGENYQMHFLDRSSPSNISMKIMLIMRVIQTYVFASVYTVHSSVVKMKWIKFWFSVCSFFIFKGAATTEPNTHDKHTWLEIRMTMNNDVKWPQKHTNSFPILCTGIQYLVCGLWIVSCDKWQIVNAKWNLQ